jgi:peptide/nickel transport system substrate-binding protein
MHLSWSGRRIRLASVALSAGMALALSACSGSSGPEPRPQGGGDSSITVFNGNTGNIAENFNPFATSFLQPTQGIIFESLYHYNLTKDEDPAPLLGTAYKWNADGTQLTITTRDGVTWSDGTPFTARDVAYSINLVVKTPSFNSFNLQATAQASDDHTAVVTFPGAAYVQEANILGYLAIVPEHIWSKKADPANDINSNPVGTGPYTVASVNPQSYELVANPHYWEPGKPKIQRVRYIALATADAASAALLAGQVDWMSSYFPGFHQLMDGQPDLKWVNTPALTTTIHTCANAGLGCTGPQTDPAVRQAIYQAIDRTQLNNLAFGGFAEAPSATMLLPERDAKWIAPGVQKTAEPNAEPARAQQILEAAGWAKGPDGIYAKDGQPLAMTIQVVSGYSDYISAIDAMTQQLAAVGIKITANQVAYNEWAANESNGTFQLSMDNIGLMPSTDPYFTYARKYATATTAPVGQKVAQNNQSRYSNPTVDAALAAAEGTDDDAAKNKQYAIIQQQIQQDLPYIPVVLGSTLTEYNTKRATGWPLDDNLYAFPATWKSWDNGIVLKNLEPVG